MTRLPLLFFGLLALGICPAAAAADLDLVPCRISAGPGHPGIKAHCGTLQRPEDPSDADSPVLFLRVAVVPALSLEPEADPLVPIAGGPGQSTIEFYALYADAFEPVRRARDIVLLDQRGTGDSARMDCDIGDGIVSGQLTPEKTIALTEQCLVSLPHRPEYFTTSVAVTDLEALRLALAYPRFNIFGASYGTRVAQHYLRRYPESVRTAILDGVVPPQLALGPEIAIEAQKALGRILDRCEQSPPCAERFPSITTDFEELRSRLEFAPVLFELANPLTGRREAVEFGSAELAGAMRLLSYNPTTVALIPLLINEALNGNYAPLASQFVMAFDRVANALALGMHNSVICTEDAPFYDDARPRRRELESTYIGTMQLEALEAICSVWPAGVLDPGLRSPLATDTPVLLLSGDADPVTPPRFAELAMLDLGNARHLIGRDQGHGQLAVGCTPEVIGRFVAAGSVIDLDARCVARQFAMPFFLDFSGPTP